MRRGLGQSAEARDQFRAFQYPRFGNRATADHLGKPGAARDRRDTAFRSEARLADDTADNLKGELQHVSARRILQLHFRVRFLYDAYVAGFLEMFENLSGVHMAHILSNRSNEPTPSR